MGQRCRTWVAVTVIALCALGLAASRASAQQVCNAGQTVSGSGLETNTTHFLGAGTGEVRISYNMFVTPDRLDVLYRGARIGGTDGFVLGPGTVLFSYQPTGGDFSVTVRMVGARADSQWTYTIFCPPAVSTVASAQAGVQAATIGTVAVVTTAVQTTNVGLRLSQLRAGRGSGTVSTNGVSFSIDGQPISLAMVTPALGGGASADRTKPLGGLGFFANGQGSFGDQKPTPGREPGFDFHTAGLTVGADYRVTDNVVLGLALGYLRTNVDLDSSASRSAVRGYSVSAYGTYYIGEKFYVDGIATYGRNEYDNERRLAVGGAPSLFTSTTDSDQYSVSASGGYNLNAGGLTFGPIGRVTYTRVEIDGYRERGDAGLAATVGDQTVESLTTALGGQATYAISVPWGVVSPLVRAEWEREFKGNGRIITSSTIAEGPVRVRANDPDRNYANVGGGASATFARGVSAFAYYEAQLGRSKLAVHSFTGGLRIDF